MLHNTCIMHRTEQQGQSRLVCCDLKFHALAIIRQHEHWVPTMPVYMPGDGGMKSCENVGASSVILGRRLCAECVVVEGRGSQCNVSAECVAGVGRRW